MSLLSTPEKRIENGTFHHSLNRSALNKVTATASSSNIAFDEPDHKSEVFWWWKKSADILAVLTREAGYDIRRQCQVLEFHRRYVVPRLGPVPTSRTNLPWQSLMTDDFGPMEFSWNWTKAGVPPQIRYSVEAIGRLAGSSFDPVNQISTLELRHDLAKHNPQTDWTLFDFLQNSFYDKKQGLHLRLKSSEGSSPTSIMMAFALDREIATKAYFFPLNAEQRNITRLQFLKEVMAQLRTEKISLSGFDHLLGFLKTPQGITCNIICLAIDCVQPVRSRYKIYVRSPDTSFERVWDMMTMGGRLKGLGNTSRANLKDLWRLTLGLHEDFNERAPLPGKAHATAGVLYYYDIKAGDEAPESKVYVPVRHYAANDRDIINGLGEYLRSRGLDDYLPNFTRALEATCSHRRLEEGAGFQTYVGCGIGKGGTLQLCSYINPEIYHPKRWS